MGKLCRSLNPVRRHSVKACETSVTPGFLLPAPATAKSRIVYGTSCKVHDKNLFFVEKQGTPSAEAEFCFDYAEVQPVFSFSEKNRRVALLRRAGNDRYHGGFHFFVLKQ
ncbi:MAG: hypothetical protein LIP00_13200, partial [Parabacteroides sp.]|nr:hypothetical protein [Parabacteroides sp.]